MNIAFSLPFDVMNIGLFGAAAFWLVTAIVHIAFAFAVLADSHLLWRHLRRKTFLVGGGMWALATLLGGVFAAAIYWLIHHSTLRPQHPPVAEAAPPVSERPVP